MRLVTTPQFLICRTKKDYVAFLLISVLHLTILSNRVSSQDLSNIGKQKNPLKVSGAVSATNIFYGASGAKARRDPYSYFLSGSLNFDIYGLSIPVSATYSNQKGSLTQPFNQYGLSPKYKWITAHLGYRTMTFSPYTLAGHIFLGAGVDLTPGKFRISALYGRLNKATPEDTLITGAGTPMYHRMGYGLKVGTGKDGNSIDVMFFKAKDELSSIPYIPEGILPAENLVIGVTGRKTLFKRVSIGLDYGNSAYTRDTRSVSERSNNLMTNTGLLTARSSTSYYQAYKTDITYTAEKYSLSVMYEHIDPGYTTMGTYFFNNDLENITLNATTRLFKDKLNLAGNVGTQRNNLDASKMTTMKRVIGAVNMNYTPIDKINLTLSYSNFTNNSKIERKFDPLQELDSLDFYQVTQSANAGIAYNFGSKERKQGLSLNGAYQIATDNLSKQISGDNQFYNANLNYRYAITPINLNLTLGVNYNQTEMSESTNSLIGPTASLSKALFKKKVRTTLGSSWNNSYTTGDLTSRVINVRWNNTYTLKKSHNFNISIIVVNRSAKSVVAKSFTEFTGTIAYNYSF